MDHIAAADFVVRSMLPALGFTDLDKVQLITPYRRIVDDLNERLARVFNPEGVSIGEDGKVRIGDR